MRSNLGIGEREAFDANIRHRCDGKVRLSKYKVSFNLLGDDRVIPVEAFVLEKVTRELPSAPLDPKALRRLGRLKLADPKFYKPGPIDILIGNDVYERLMMAGKIEETEE